MALLAAVILLSTSLTISKADSDLSVQKHVIGTWRSSVTLLCSYTPMEYTQNIVTWLFDGETIMHRDHSGDQVFLNKYRGRLSIPMDNQGGNISLTIQDLQTDDKGMYTCKATLTSNIASAKINKEVTITLDVKKVAATKPVIQPGGASLAVSEKATVTLTCTAEGSPPINYKWYKKSVTDGSHKLLKTQRAVLMIPNAQQSDSGAYFCEAKNSLSRERVQKSDMLQLTVTADTVVPATTPKLTMSSTEGMSSRGWSDTTRGQEPNHTKGPSSTKGDTVTPATTPTLTMSSMEGMGSRGHSGTTRGHEPNHTKTPSTKGDTVAPATTPKFWISSTEGMGSRERSGTTQRHEPNHTKSPSSTKGHTVAPETTPKLWISSTEGMGSTERPGTTRQHEPTHTKAPSSTKGFNTTAPIPFPEKNEDRPTSSGMSLFLIILIAVLSLILLCALIALLATLCPRRKATGDISQIQTMSVLSAQQSQDSPGVNVCQINICQINSSQTDSCQSNGMAGPKKENDYLPLPTKDKEPASIYQDIVNNHENEYELLLTEKEKQF